MADLRIPLDYTPKKLPRGVFNLSQPIVTTMMQGLNKLVKWEPLKPTDRFGINYDQVLQSMPMVGQLLNNFRLNVWCFNSDLSNYYSWMDNNNRQSAGETKNRQHHYISPKVIPSGTDRDNLVALIFPPDVQLAMVDGDTSVTIPSQVINNFLRVVPATSSNTVVPININSYPIFKVQPDSMLDMVGIPAGYFSSKYVTSPFVFDRAYCFNADALLTYLDAHRNYMVNNQYGYLPFYYTLPVFSITTQSSTHFLSYKGKHIPRFGDIALTNIDKFIKLVRMADNGVDLFDLAITNQLYDVAHWLVSLKYGGEFLAQYDRDMLTGLLYNNSYEDVMVEVDENGRFSVNSLRFANKHQIKEDREQIAGGRYSNRLRTLWGAKHAKSMDIPDLVGVHSYVIDPRHLISTADTSSVVDGQPQGANIGQLAGVVSDQKKAKYKYTVTTTNDSILMFIVQIVPRVMYCNGLGKGLDVHSFDDEYYPQFDQLGWQDVPRYKYNCLPTWSGAGTLSVSSNVESTYNKVMGKTIPFIDLISNVGRVHGKFGSDEYFEPWVLKRGFEYDYKTLSEDGFVTVSNPESYVSPYVNPLKYQYPFTVTGPTDPNFVLMFDLDIRAVRAKGKTFMPTLGQ